MDLKLLSHLRKFYFITNHFSFSRAEVKDVFRVRNIFLLYFTVW